MTPLVANSKSTIAITVSAIIPGMAWKAHSGSLRQYPVIVALKRSTLLVRWIGFLVLGVLSVIGCAPEQHEAIPQIVFKHPRLLSREAPLRMLLDQFRRRHPALAVREEVLPSSSDQQHLFYVTNLEAEANDFDVFALDIIWIPEFRRAGWLQNLSPYLESERLDDFFPAAAQVAYYKGQVYALPWFADAGALYYRRDLLEKYNLSPPRTMSELVHAAQMIMQGENNPRLSGFVWQGKQYEGLICVALEFIRAYGGKILDAHGQSFLTQPSTVAGLQALRNVIAKTHISPPFVTTADEEMARHVFSRGEAVFMRNWPYAWSLLNAEGSSMRGRIGVTAMPSTSGREATPTLGGWFLGVNRFSKYPQLAWKLIAFLTSEEAQRELAVAGGLKPTRLSIYSDPRTLREDPSLELFFPLLQAARPRPITPFYLMISQVLQGEFSAVVTGIKPAAVALSDAERQVQQILSLDTPEVTRAQASK